MNKNWGTFCVSIELYHPTIHLLDQQNILLLALRNVDHVHVPNCDGLQLRGSGFFHKIVKFQIKVN